MVDGSWIMERAGANGIQGIQVCRLEKQDQTPDFKPLADLSKKRSTFNF
jgi:hypothetical protein